MLSHYLTFTQMLLTISAAAIAFGGDKNPPSLVHLAKVCLAFSILFGVMFAGLLLYRYDTYTQDVTSHSKRWYSAIQSFGFSSLVCFFWGFLFWSIGI